MTNAFFASVTGTGSVRKKRARHKRHFMMPNNRRAFRLRFGDGRSPNRRPKLDVC